MGRVGKRGVGVLSQKGLKVVELLEDVGVWYNDRSVVVDNDKPVIKVECDVAILDLSAMVVESIGVQSEARLGRHVFWQQVYVGGVHVLDLVFFRVIVTREVGLLRGRRDTC